jgi:hypothetical protein
MCPAEQLTARYSHGRELLTLRKGDNQTYWFRSTFLELYLLRIGRNELRSPDGTLLCFLDLLFFNRNS